MVVGQLPAALLQHEDIGRGQWRAGHELATDDDRHLSNHGSLCAARHQLGLTLVGEDASPAFDYRLAARKYVPARMDAVHWHGARPQRLHRVLVLLVESSIERLVGRQYRFLVHSGRPTPSNYVTVMPRIVA